MRYLLLATPILTGLSGCSSLDMISDDVACRHVLSPTGHAVRFCESQNLVTVDDRPPPSPPPGRRLIDDPEFLKGMLKQLRPANHTSTVATAATRPSPPGYITIAESDFIALVREAWRHGLGGDPVAAKQASVGYAH